MEIVLLDILAMVAFLSRQAEQSLLKAGVPPVPQCQCETKVLMTVANSRQTVFIPTVGPRPGMIVWEITPRAAVCAVVLAHGAPGAFGYVRPPTVPVSLLTAGLLQAGTFACVINFHLDPLTPSGESQ